MPAIGQPRDKWQSIYEFLRQQTPGTQVTWRTLTEVAGHDVRASRAALTRAGVELAKVGLTYRNQSIDGVEVQEL